MRGFYAQECVRSVTNIKEDMFLSVFKEWMRGDINTDIHGNRLEKRTVCVYDDLYEIKGWIGVKSIVTLEREVRIKGTDKTTKERAYFISSLQKPASFFQKAIRGLLGN